MKIDGFKPIGADVTREFEYPLPFGVIKITARMANSRHNKQLARDLKGHQELIDRQERVGDVDDELALQSLLGILFQHVVVEWSTSITSGKKSIEATRDNFVALLSNEACDKVATMFIADVADPNKFHSTEEADAKN